jgi:hypothetical protein
MKERSTMVKKKTKTTKEPVRDEVSISDDDVRFIDKADELPLRFDDDSGANDKDGLNNEFWLKKQTAEVYSDQRELNKDFTLSNLSDQMFDSKVVNFIMGRIFLVKLVENIFKFANRDIYKRDEKGAIIFDPNTKLPSELRIPKRVKDRIKWETYEYVRTRNLILTEVYTILNLSKARGGLILKAFLRGGLTDEEMETIAGETSTGEVKRRTVVDRLLGRNKPQVQPGAMN